jgi:rhamnulokinase
MKRTPTKALVPGDKRALIAIDLGAESCRISLLRWNDDRPTITLVHRFANAPREADGGLRWDLTMIEAGLDEGLRRCAAIADEGVRSIAVDGWAVDYVYIDRDGKALGDPFCYRDDRTVEAELSLHQRISPERIRELTGVQLLRINTLYQLHADVRNGLPEGQQWLNLPEYILSRLGGARVAELTNATHTQMIQLCDRTWCREIFEAAGLDPTCAPKIVPSGTIIGKLSGTLAELAAFRDTLLIAPACHDTASAIAGIPAEGDDWAYISAGTWSLVGTLLDEPRNGSEASAENFTNLSAVGNRTCFHKNVNGMWMLRQCMRNWSDDGTNWTVQDLVAVAQTLPRPHGLLDVDHPDFLLAGRMTERINIHLLRDGHEALDEKAENAPAFANLIFHSLAARYAHVLQRLAYHSGKTLKRLFIVGGASQNDLLNRLTAEATGLQVLRGSTESSSVGNFATQMAALESIVDPVTGVSAGQVSQWAKLFMDASSLWRNLDLQSESHPPSCQLE